MKEIEKIIFQKKEELNIHEYAFINSEEVIFSEEVRAICKSNGCGMYGKSWACPPVVGSVKSCEERCRKFKYAFVFTSSTYIEDKYDVEEWLRILVIHEKITDCIVKIFRSEFKEILPLSTEGCRVCKTCTYPDKPCRFPGRMYPATEGFGILVTQLAKEANIRYNNGENNLTYFSVIFF